MCRACTTDPVMARTCPERVRDDLRRIYLFEELDDARLDKIIASARSIDLEDDRWLYRQGEWADNFYLVRDGQVALFRQTEDGREAIIAIVGSDEAFAEELLLVEQPIHDLNAKAVGDSSVIAFESSSLRQYLQNSTSLCFKIASTLHRRQQMLFDQIERLALHDATERVMAYFLDQVGDASGTQRVQLSIPKSTLAAHLSIQPETLSRSLGRLKECQFLEQQGDSLLLVHTDELRKGLKCAHCSIRSWGCPGPDYLRDSDIETAYPMTAESASKTSSDVLPARSMPRV